MDWYVKVRLDVVGFPLLHCMVAFVYVMGVYEAVDPGAGITGVLYGMKFTVPLQL